MNNKFIVLIFLLFILSGCAYSQTQVMAVDHRPTIVIKNAPSEALLYVDGLLVGNTVEYNGDPNSLTVESGTHKVEIRSASQALIYQETIFVESEQKTIKVR